MVTPATTTNSVGIIRKNQKHILDVAWRYTDREDKVKSKAEAFVKWIDAYKDRDHPTAYSVITWRLSGGEGLIYTSEIRKYLHSLGLTDDRRLDNFNFKYWDYRWKEMDGPMGLYMALVARDGQKLYNSLKKGKNPVAPKKKKTVRKPKTNGFGL